MLSLAPSVPPGPPPRPPAVMIAPHTVYPGAAAPVEDRVITWNGQQYRLTVYLQPFTPPTPAPVLSISGYRDVRTGSTTTVAAGDQLVVSGQGFGVAAGSARLDPGAFPLAVVSWSDTRVTLTMPTQGALPAQGTVTLVRVDARGVTGPPLSIVPAPAPGKVLRSAPPGSDEADPIPTDWAGEVPAVLETNPFRVGGVAYVLQIWAGGGAPATAQGLGSVTVGGWSVGLAGFAVPVLLGPARGKPGRKQAR